MSTRRFSAAVGGVAVILVLSACGTGGSVVGKSADQTNGHKIFQTTCAGCHILAAAGSQGTFGPNLDAAFAEARSEGKAWELAEGYARHLEQLREGAT